MASTHISDDTCNVLPSKISQRKPRDNVSVIKERLFHIQAISNNEPHITHLDYKLIHEKRLAKEVSAELDLGRIEITYSNNAVASLSETLIDLKQLPSFRDLNLMPSCLFPNNTENLLSAEDKESKKTYARATEALQDFNDSTNNETRKKAKTVNNLV